MILIYIKFDVESGLAILRIKAFIYVYLGFTSVAFKTLLIEYFQEQSWQTSPEIYLGTLLLSDHNVLDVVTVCSDYVQSAKQSHMVHAICSTFLGNIVGHKYTLYFHSTKSTQNALDIMLKILLIQVPCWKHNTDSCLQMCKLLWKSLALWANETAY